jgi:putative serine protease PepD
MTTDEPGRPEPGPWPWAPDPERSAAPSYAAGPSEPGLPVPGTGQLPGTGPHVPGTSLYAPGTGLHVPGTDPGAPGPLVPPDAARSGGPPWAAAAPPGPPAETPYSTGQAVGPDTTHTARPGNVPGGVTGTSSGASPGGPPEIPAWPSDTVGLAGERKSRRTAVLVTLGLLIAVIAALLGGLIGGYVGSRRAAGSVANQTYNPGPAPAAVTNRPPASVAGIAARILPSVVMIKVNGGTGTGSGFIIDGGYIITNNHVVTLDGQVKGAKLQVFFNGGQTAPAKLVGTDPYSDIAVIRPQGISNLFPVRLGNSDGVAVGDPVIAVGSPLGLQGTVTSGIVSALNRPVQAGDLAGSASQTYIDAIQTDAPINPGNSGGPLVNAQGQVVGVNSAIATLGGGSIGGSGQSGSIGLGFAIPINQARRVAQQLVRTGVAVHPVIGAVIDMSYPGDGARIATSGTGRQPPVVPGGPSAKAGLRAGDVIVAFDGKPVTRADELIVDIRSHQPGDKVRITYRRGAARHTVTLTLGSASST